MNSKPEVQKFAGGDIYFWIEHGSFIHLKAISPHGDPAEMTAEDARALAEALIAAAQQIDPLK